MFLHMPLKLNKETVEFIQENFDNSLFSLDFNRAPGIGNSLVFIKSMIIFDEAEPVNIEISVRWTEEAALNDLVEVYFKSFTKNRVYTTRYDLDLSASKTNIKKKINSLATFFEDYTRKFFLLTLIKKIQVSRKLDTGDYLGGETNKLLLSMKEIDFIDTTVYSTDELTPPFVNFVDGSSVSFNDPSFSKKMSR